MSSLDDFAITKKWPAQHPDRIQLYSLPTPNGVKASIMLEETGLPYEVHRVAFDTKDQFTPEFLSLSPNNKIPAILDPNGPDGKPLGLFESGAILVYLASKAGQFIPADAAGRFETLQWVMFQMGGVGPMLGQAHHFRIYAPEKIEYAINRYTNEAKRLYGVIDKRLSESKFLGGADYSIADIATWPWLRSWKNQGIELSDYPKLQRWFEAIEERPAVQRAVKVLAKERPAVQDDKAKEILFGATQYERR